jgi:hypothetical protein
VRRFCRRTLDLPVANVAHAEGAPQHATHDLQPPSPVIQKERSDEASFLDSCRCHGIVCGMRMLVLLLAACTLLPNVYARQDQLPSTTEKPPDVSLRLRIELEGQSYCHIDDESFALNMQLALHFTNVSNHPVILSRRIESPSVVRVTRDAEAARRNDWLYDPRPLSIVATLPPAPRFGKTPDPKLFVILNPGKKFTTVVSSGVFGAAKASKATKGSGLLAKNVNYVLQVGVSTWPYVYPYFESRTTAQELKLRWRDSGDLAIGLVYSDFAPFNIPETFDNPRCPLNP